MEDEIRFYYSESKYEELKKMLKINKELKYQGCFYELTIQYDHPVEEQSFYQKNIDGRFRVRTSKEIDTNKSKAKISWKRRIENTFNDIVNKEEEIELNFEYEEIENLKFLLEKIIKMKRIESYERYRNIFINDDVEIVIDKYPFGVALEIENKNKEKKPEEIIMSWVKKLNLDRNDIFRLSWDDKYTQLCKEQNVEIFKDVKFGKLMPKIID